MTVTVSVLTVNLVATRIFYFHRKAKPMNSCLFLFPFVQSCLESDRVSHIAVTDQRCTRSKHFNEAMEAVSKWKLGSTKIRAEFKNDSGSNPF
jgi:hypothetical protein